MFLFKIAWKPWFHEGDITGLCSELRQRMVVMVCTISDICTHILRSRPSCISFNGLRDVHSYSDTSQAKRRAHGFMVYHTLPGFTHGWRWLTRCNMVGSPNTLPISLLFASYLLTYSTEKDTSKVAVHVVRKHSMISMNSRARLVG